MKWFRRLWPYAVLVLLVGANILLWSQRVAIADWWRLRDYTPSAAIAALAQNSGMTEAAQKLFYINHPSLESKESFNLHCSDHGEETAVLGCYHGDRQGIYIYAVKDDRLAGVQEVTAAHEMLHQAYDRLSSADKEHVGGLLQTFFKDGLQEQDVREKLETYKKRANVDLVNEMHSIFGSEVREVSPELEAYYKRYFSDRLKVVTLSEAYQGEFTRRQELVKKYDAELAQLKAQIQSNRTTLEREVAFLSAKEKEISDDIASRNQAEYESDVRTYNQTVISYNALLNKTKGLIEEHNRIVVARNELAVQEQELQAALDSKLQAPPKMQ